MNLEHEARSYFKREKFEIVREVFITVIIAALVSGAINYYFNRKVDADVANRQFVYEFSRTFFDNPKYREVSIALEESYLYGRGPVMKTNGGRFTDYQIDDFLTHLTELYLFGDEGFVSFDLLNYQFGYYVCIAFNNDEIQQYSERLKTQGFNKPFGTFEKLAEEMEIARGMDCKVIES